MRLRIVRLSGMVLLAVMAAAAAAAQDGLTAWEAVDHVGEEGTVCGLVASTHFARTSRGQPTFLNLEKPYPDQPFVVVVWGTDRRRFPVAPELAFADKHLCITGLIEVYRGKAEIIVSEPSQMEVRD